MKKRQVQRKKKDKGKETKKKEKKKKERRKRERNRDGEFIDNLKSREEIMAYWEQGWNCLFETLSSLKPEDLEKTVYIRNEAHTVLRAIHRQLTHYAYHCGQIVFLCKHLRQSEFKSLSIPKGDSLKYVTTPPKNS